MDEAHEEEIYDKTMEQIEAFSSTLSDEERKQLALISPALFGKIWQAAVLAGLELIEKEMK